MHLSARWGRGWLAFNFWGSYSHRLHQGKPSLNKLLLDTAPLFHEWVQQKWDVIFFFHCFGQRLHFFAESSPLNLRKQRFGFPFSVYSIQHEALSPIRGIDREPGFRNILSGCSPYFAY